MPKLLLKVDFITLLQELKPEQKLDLELYSLQSDLSDLFGRLLNYDMLKEENGKQKLRSLANGINRNKKIQIVNYYRGEYSLLLQNFSFQALFNESGKIKDDILNAVRISHDIYEKHKDQFDVSFVNAFMAAISSLKGKENISVISSDTLKKNLAVYLSKCLIHSDAEYLQILTIREDICKKLRELSLSDTSEKICKGKLLRHLELIPNQKETLIFDENEMRALMANHDLFFLFNGCIDYNLLFPTTSLDLNKDYRLKIVETSYGLFSLKEETLVTRQNKIFSKCTDPLPQTFTFESPTLTQQQALNFKLSANFEEWKIFLKDTTSLTQSWSTNQKTYAHQCYDSVQDAVQNLTEENSSMNAMELYQFLANKRQLIAKVATPDADVSAFGKMRDEVVQSYASQTFIFANQGRYKDFYPYLKELHDSQKNTRKPGIAVEGTGIIQQIDSSHIENESGNSTSPLMLSSFCTNKEYNETALKLRLKEQKEQPDVDLGPSILIFHTKTSEIPRIFKKIDPIFNKLVHHQGEASEEDIKNIGRAMPCERGSAAIAEMYIATLFKKIGLPLVPYRNGEKNCPSIDLEAIFESNIENFAYKFASWYNVIPRDEKNLTIHT